MKFLKKSAVAAAVMSMVTAPVAASAQVETPSTNVCRLVARYIIDNEIYEHWQCVYYTNGQV